MTWFKALQAIILFGATGILTNIIIQTMLDFTPNNLSKTILIVSLSIAGIVSTVIFFIKILFGGSKD